MSSLQSTGLQSTVYGVEYSRPYFSEMLEDACIMAFNAKKGRQAEDLEGYKLCRQATKSEASYTKNECNNLLLKITS